MTARTSPKIVRRIAPRLLALAILPAALVVPAQAAAPTADDAIPPLEPTVTEAVAHDESATLASLAAASAAAEPRALPIIPAERFAVVRDDGFHGDGAVQREAPSTDAASIPFVNFEAQSSQDNFDVFGCRPNPPDTVGDVGPDHYVQMVNLLFAVYSKTGEELVPPTDIGALWSDFALEDCTDRSGDPIVVYDQFADRWILSQFTTSGLADPTLPFYNCVAISTSGDPTGTYYRYAFTTGFNFPDYPKYGVWRNTYVVTTREFGPTTEYGIGVYGLQKYQMLQGKSAKAIQLLHRRQRSRPPAAGRRRTAPSRHRRQEASRPRVDGPLGRHAGRRVRLRRQDGRRQRVGLRREVAAARVRDAGLQRPAAGRRVRLGLPVRT